MEFARTQKYVLSALALVVTAAFLTSCPGALGADWPNWRGPDYSGVSSEPGWSTDWPQDGPRVLWEASLGPGFASMAVSKGRVINMEAMLNELISDARAVLGQ